MWWMWVDIEPTRIWSNNKVRESPFCKFNCSSSKNIKKGKKIIIKFNYVHRVSSDQFKNVIEMHKFSWFFMVIRKCVNHFVRETEQRFKIWRWRKTVKIHVADLLIHNRTTAGWVFFFFFLIVRLIRCSDWA